MNFFYSIKFSLYCTSQLPSLTHFAFRLIHHLHRCSSHWLRGWRGRGRGRAWPDVLYPLIDRTLSQSQRGSVEVAARNKSDEGIGWVAAQTYPYRDGECEKKKKCAGEGGVIAADLDFDRVCHWRSMGCQPPLEFFDYARWICDEVFQLHRYENHGNPSNIIWIIRLVRRSETCNGGENDASFHCGWQLRMYRGWSKSSLRKTLHQLAM